MARDQPSQVRAELRQMCSYTTAGYAALGAAFYDLSGARFGRDKAQTLSAEALTLACLADDLIDDTKMVTAQQAEAIEHLWCALSEGRYAHDSLPRLNALARIAVDLRQRVTEDSRADSFFVEFETLKQVVFSQINGEGSLDVAETLGTQAMALAAIFPYCYDSSLPPRFLAAAKCWGASLQIRDDLLDYEDDKRRGQATFMTKTSDPDLMRVYAQRRERELYQQGLSLLFPSERRVLRSLNFLSALHGNLIGKPFWQNY